ncbi:retrovirus-related pol polyprotein from transposon TNT 1-94 [Tanacetum coccineum]
MEAEVDQNAIDKRYTEIERKNLLITNENLIANCIAQDMFYTVTDSTLYASRFHDLSTAYNVAMNRVVELEFENSCLLRKIEHDDHDTMIKAFSKLESPRDIPEFDVFFELGMRDDQIQSHKNTIRKLKVQISELKANKSENNRDQCPLTMITKPKALSVKQWKPTGRLIPLDGQCPLVRPPSPTNSPNPVASNFIILWYLDSGCSKHKTGDRSRLRNFVKKFIETVIFRNDHFGAIMGYGDYVIGDACKTRGLPRMKFEKDHLCSACQLRKSRKATYKPKTINIIMEVLHTLQMDLCSPMRVQSINGKKYILVIVDDYSRFTWVKFLRSKDETPVFIINLLKQLQVSLNKTVRFVQTDNGTELVHKDLIDYYENIGITHEKTVPRTPRQNGVVERHNRTLIEAARTMLIFSKAPLFLWAEAMATACYTQNRSLIHTLHDKTPYKLVHDKKLDLSFLRIFWALCYPTNDSEDLGKLKAKADIRPAPNLLTPGPISSRLVPTSAPAIPYVPPTNKELELLFQPMFDEYFKTTMGDPQMPIVPSAQAPTILTGPSVSISFDSDAPSGSHSPSSSAHQSSSVHHGVATEHSFEVNPFAAIEHEPFVNVFALDLNSKASSSGIIMIPIPNQSTKPHEHLRKWTDSHPLDNIIGNPSRPVSTRKQLAIDALWCFYNLVLSKVKPKNFKSAVTEDCWFQAMQ